MKLTALKSKLTKIGHLVQKVVDADEVLRAEIAALPPELVAHIAGKGPLLIGTGGDDAAALSALKIDVVRAIAPNLTMAVFTFQMLLGQQQDAIARVRGAKAGRLVDVHEELEARDRAAEKAARKEENRRKKAEREARKAEYEARKAKYEVQGAP